MMNPHTHTAVRSQNPSQLTIFKAGAWLARTPSVHFRSIPFGCCCSSCFWQGLVSFASQNNPRANRTHTHNHTLFNFFFFSLMSFLPEPDSNLELLKTRNAKRVFFSLLPGITLWRLPVLARAHTHTHTLRVNKQVFLLFCCCHCCCFVLCLV